jgi:hypothetical protein
MAGQYCSYCGSRNRAIVYRFKKPVPHATKDLGIWVAKYARPYCKKCRFHEEVFYHIITVGWFRVRIEHKPTSDVKIWHEYNGDPKSLYIPDTIQIKSTNKLIYDSWSYDTDY